MKDIGKKQPVIALCNIFDQDAERLSEFAAMHDFSGIDWSIDPSLSEKQFLSLMKSLAGFQVRFHCRFFGVDIAYADQRGNDSLALLMRTVENVANAGGRHMTVHSGLGNPSGDGIDVSRAIGNLAVLAAHGNNNGVSVALENLTTPLTNDPCMFRRIVAESGAYVTVDIGHAHAVRHRHPQDDVAAKYILPNLDRVFNAHVYHTELDGYGHVPPNSISDISSRLDLLGLANACDWWAIELMNPAEVLHTRAILQNYLDSRAIQPGPLQQDIRLPLAVA
ncbi:MAG: TIM barrel protein [Geobacteraceae bacterium]|nr:TIM barrel protein [Geobacteraceae bacterium]